MSVWIPAAVVWLAMLAAPVLLVRKGILPASFNLPVAIWVGGCTAAVILCFLFWIQEVIEK